MNEETPTDMPARVCASGPRTPTRLRVGGLAVVLGLVLAAAGPARALSARALVDRTELAADEVLSLTVVVSDGDGEVDTAPIADFEVASRGRSSSVQIVNTRVSREIRYRYALTPRRSGRLTVPSLVVRSGAEEVLTDPIAIRVRAPGAEPGGTRDVAVSAWVTEAAPVVGQEIVYTFQLAAAVPLLEARYQAPSFDGFSVTPLEEQATRQVVQNGRQVTLTELSYLLTPEREGALSVGPAVLTCQVPAPDDRAARRRRDPLNPFDDPFFRRNRVVEKTLRAPPVAVAVRPLPPAPPGFSGLVGSFSLSAALAPAELSVGESATLTLVVEGEGGVAEAASPELRPPDSFKVYPDNPETEVERSAQGTRGARRFRYALVPTEAGTHTLGPFQLVVFDPREGAYRTLQAGPLGLRVTPGKTARAAGEPAPTADSPEPGAVRKRSVEQTGHDILDLHRGLDALVGERPMGAGVFALWLAAPAVLCAGLWVFSAVRRRKPGPSEQMAVRARQLLRRARQADDVEWAGLLRRALVSAVFARAGRSGESLTYAEARELTAGAGVPPAQGESLAALLQALDAAQYGGGAGAEQRRLLEQGERLVRDLLRGARA